MTFEQLFGLANFAALASWIALAVLPRWPILIGALRFGAIGALALVYAVLISVYFFRISGGGFGSIVEVRALFQSDPMLVAGWIHYLAFDLFVGIWIARRADEAGIHRLVQVPLLALTFLFGPAGLLAFFLTRATGLVPTLKPRI
jgi:hypothetical protein